MRDSDKSILRAMHTSAKYMPVKEQKIVFNDLKVKSNFKQLAPTVTMFQLSFIENYCHYSTTEEV
ncbi:hypothetical protein T02_5994 [Trichinella nativa]|uniref:Uncharacterized protein n=1 Tax=Trichinella nativa TaxID=6335 RepID=A0A0V1LMV6_9BILA|nr:hypothetical protein T02_5994 [Trichinella nativa]